jgi:hypothetical protein
MQSAGEMRSQDATNGQVPTRGLGVSLFAAVAALAAVDLAAVAHLADLSAVVPAAFSR